jgi:hypothetical protein
MTQDISYAAKIVKALGKLGVNGTENPDAKHNTGRALGEIFMWNTVKKYVEGKLDNAWERAQKEGVIDLNNLAIGEYELASSPTFLATVKVSQPVRRFSPEALATELNKKYKVPLPIAKEMIEAAKVPTKSTVTKSIIEKQ